MAVHSPCTSGLYNICRGLVRPTRSSSGCSGRTHASRTFAATSSARDTVRLAYDLWEPPSRPGETRASGNPIVFAHGLFGSKKNNRSMSKVLARELCRPVYAIDLRNHGASPHHPRHDYTALAEDIEGFLAEHDLRKPTLIGHSMGAKAVMAVALRDSARVEALVSIDNAPVDAALASDFGTYVTGMRKVEEAGVRKQSDADEILQGYVESLPVRQFLLTNLHRPSGSPPGAPLTWRIPLRTLGAALGAMADFPFKGDAHARFEGPALFVRGTKSKYVADDVLPVVGRFFPRFRLADVEAGHWIVSENPEAFRAAVVDFLGPSE